MVSAPRWRCSPGAVADTLGWAVLGERRSLASLRLPPLLAAPGRHHCSIFLRCRRRSSCCEQSSPTTLPRRDEAPTRHGCSPPLESSRRDGGPSVATGGGEWQARDETRTAGTRSRVGMRRLDLRTRRGTFYPGAPPAARELQHAASCLTTIEINGTFYRTQTPATFAKWRDETPDDFVFAVAPRYVSRDANSRAQATRSRSSSKADRPDWKPSSALSSGSSRRRRSSSPATSRRSSNSCRANWTAGRAPRA